MNRKDRRKMQLSPKHIANINADLAQRTVDFSKLVNETITKGMIDPAVCSFLFEKVMDGLQPPPGYQHRWTVEGNDDGSVRCNIFLATPV